jgi:hypothetical protein
MTADKYRLVAVLHSMAKYHPATSAEDRIAMFNLTPLDYRRCAVQTPAQFRPSM